MSALKAGRPSSTKKSKTLHDLKNEGKTRLNADIPRDLYKQVKIRALEDDISITQLVQLALTDYLSK